jgi:hypothetical protein
MHSEHDKVSNSRLLLTVTDLYQKYGIIRTSVARKNANRGIGETRMQFSALVYLIIKLLPAR